MDNWEHDEKLSGNVIKGYFEKRNIWDWIKDTIRNLFCCFYSV